LHILAWDNGIGPFGSGSLLEINYVLLAILAVANGQGPFTVPVLNGSMTITWMMTTGTNGPILQATVKSNSVAWIGIGWHMAGASGPENVDMYDVDFAIADFSGGSPPRVTDRKSNNNVNNGYSPPLLDTDPAIGGTNDITASSGVQDATTSTFSFTKLYNTGDARGDQSLQNGLQHVIIAHGNSNTFSYHGNVNRGHWMINFYTGANAPCMGC